jgi:hypothetical protein
MSRWCPHGGPGFVPWHRFYLCAVENCMVSVCLTEMRRFRPLSVRTDMLRRVCYLLRMPYWDWAVDS